MGDGVPPEKTTNSSRHRGTTVNLKGKNQISTLVEEGRGKRKMRFKGGLKRKRVCEQRDSKDPQTCVVPPQRRKKKQATVGHSLQVPLLSGYGNGWQKAKQGGRKKRGGVGK